MCLAIFKPKGVPCDEFLYEGIRNSAKGNRDGLGFALKRGGKLHIKKGLYQNESESGYDIEKFINDIKDQEVGIDEELMVHLRMATMGKVTDINCHPFTCSKSILECTAPNTITDKPALIHNGGFNDFKRTQPDLSDTFEVTNQYFSEMALLHLARTNPELFRKLIKPIVGHNKVVLMFPQEKYNTILLGEFQIDKGIYFSNGSYKSYTKRFNDTTPAIIKEKVYAYPDKEEDDDNLVDGYSMSSLLPATTSKIEQLSFLDLTPGLVFRFNMSLFVRGVLTNDPSTTTTYTNFEYQIVDSFRVEKRKYWSVLEIKSGKTFSISEGELLTYGRLVLDKNGDKIIKGKLIPLSQFDNPLNLPSELIKEIKNIDRSLLYHFDPSQWSAGKYKKFLKLKEVALRKARDKNHIKLGEANGKKSTNFGPFSLKFISFLVTRYELLKDKESNRELEPELFI